MKKRRRLWGMWQAKMKIGSSSRLVSVARAMLVRCLRVRGSRRHGGWAREN